MTTIYEALNFLNQTIENQKAFIERDHVIESTVDHMQSVRRNEIFRNKIQSEIDYPSAKKLDMRKPRLVDAGESEFSVINDRLS